MSKRSKTIYLIVWFSIIGILLVGIFIIPAKPKTETVKELMKDAVLHEENKVNLFGIMNVNPACISAFTVTGITLLAALLIRIFAIPRFKKLPGKFQLLLEQAVGFFDSLAKANSPHRTGFIGVYIFCAGAYIFIGTIFELFGLQVVCTSGTSVAMPAPLSDINGAIAMGVTTFLMIVLAGLFNNGLKGLGSALKEFSLPISMSFRLFGALLSGLLVTELVYYYQGLSYVLPVIVGILFTLIHAIIQTYVLTMLASVFYGEVTEKHIKPIKTQKK